MGTSIFLLQIQKKSNIQSKALTLDTASTVNALDCSVESDKLLISPEEQNLFDLINNYRREQGLNPLTWSDPLIMGASWMSNDMFINRSLSHTDSLGRNVPIRLADCGYIGPASIGENIDSGTIDSQTILNAWKHSPQQNANLLNSNFKEIGIALESNQDNSISFWTLDLGSFDSKSTPTPNISVIPSPTFSPTPTIPNLPTPTTTLIPFPTKPFIPKLPPKPTPTLPPDYVPNPLDMQLFAAVKVTGIGLGGNLYPKNLTRHVVVGIYDLNNNLVTESNGFLVYDRINLFRGVIHFGPVENGTYFIKILSDHMLRVIVLPTFQVLDKNRLNVLPETKLLQGDIDDDNVIDIKDYNLALVCFQNRKCKDKDKELIDFNDDTRADVIDYNILLRNYWEAQGD